MILNNVKKLSYYFIILFLIIYWKYFNNSFVEKKFTTERYIKKNVTIPKPKLNLTYITYSTTRIPENQVLLPPPFTQSDLELELDLETKISNPRIAYLILAHNYETCENALDIIEFLQSPNHVFILHLDAKMKFSKHKLDVDKNNSEKSCLLDRVLKFSNVYLTKNRIDVQWGSLSIWKAELETMKMALNYEWDYGIIICGSSWPTKTSKVMSNVISKYMKKDSNAIFLNGKIKWCPDNNPSDVCNRLKYYCVNSDCSKTYYLPPDLKIYKDFQNLILSRSTINYFVNDKSMKNFWLPMFQFIFAAEETLPQTLIMNHPLLKETIKWHESVGDDFIGAVYQSWAGEKCKSYANPRPCCSPCYLGLNDWDDLINLKQIKKSFFLRKIYWNEPLKEKIKQYAIQEEKILFNIKSFNIINK